MTPSLKQNERLFQVSECSTIYELKAALKSDNGLVRRSAQEELDLRAEKAKKEARMKAQLGPDKKPGKPSKSVPVASQTPAMIETDECVS